ncbi:MAG: hypothetical protein N4J56_006807 [Chroococcidiopsis sp. SAG 2025]|uniref:hypothetical protein n=1 Tax=Chroococcidiopsis sp. SAG 2025 TaxID=171389 RepID=UPI002936FF57|nr:hypothetical protein [Chroococcidiopsis sp. SAG 2025]MDV2997102.1 hypothetical protein [Chroococcidiopsis sp. SAG 2025]
MSQLFRLHNFDIHKLVHELVAIGAASVPLLSEDFRLALLLEAASYSYIPEAEIVGKGNQTVRQQMSSFADFPRFTLYRQLRSAFQNLLDEHLTAVTSYPFATKLNFNTMVLQKYELGSLGITPHRDRSSYINLACIFTIGGQGKFYLCDDRCGSNAQAIDSHPGSVLFLRAPGFMNSPQRPFHYVNEIQSVRYTYGLRQTATAC